jgi:hypothetical protein
MVCADIGAVSGTYQWAYQSSISCRVAFVSRVRGLLSLRRMLLENAHGGELRKYGSLSYSYNTVKVKVKVMVRVRFRARV